MHTDSERLYVDLIFRATRKYPSWDPEIQIKVGDYGRITKGEASWRDWLTVLGLNAKQKGIFVKEGNIYEDGIAQAFDIPAAVHQGGGRDEDVTQRRLQAAASDDHDGVMWVTSKNVRTMSKDLKLGGGLQGLANLRLHAGFKLTSGRGAILAMEHETVTYLDRPGSLLKLLMSERLHGRVIVSEVHQCSSYARYLVSEGGKTVSIGLGAEVPCPGAPGVSALGEVAGSWYCDAAVGNFKAKINQVGEKVFCPLYRLVAVEERRPCVGLRGPIEQAGLSDVEPPWTPVEDEEEDDFAALGTQGTWSYT
ncbi:hypothetical protein CPB83DRAFT_796373 [Crepidotus variabilis]|uniref:Uncharacterized protein n=1 Tax=Crepidotus variabilis TaxID=179855 RepID=A0A9P6EAD0_9AGAR|nr:hypothetical protein CPB83DRAFT_796373 [Crepidotus variabilis]